MTHWSWKTWSGAGGCSGADEEHPIEVDDAGTRAAALEEAITDADKAAWSLSNALGHR